MRKPLGGLGVSALVWLTPYEEDEIDSDSSR